MIPMAAIIRMRPTIENTPGWHCRHTFGTVVTRADCDISELTNIDDETLELASLIADQQPLDRVATFAELRVAGQDVEFIERLVHRNLVARVIARKRG